MRLYQMYTDTDQQIVRELFWEYLQWANENVNRIFNINFDIAAMLEEDMQSLDKFMPPHGRLLLAEIAGKVAGLGCLKILEPSIGEIKRMYTRPDFRQRGIGRAVLEGLIDEGRNIGYTHIRLDSARFMENAHQLYRSMGFVEIEAYAGSEIPEDFQPNWLFMELTLI